MAALLWAVVVGVRTLAAAHPLVVERVYARQVYPRVAAATAALTAAFPFSVAEAAVLLLAPALPWWAWRTVRSRRASGGGRMEVAAKVLRTTAFAGAAVLLFDLMWALNYHRQPVAVLLSYEVSPVSAEELAALTSGLIEESARLREGLLEDADGVLRLGDGRSGALGRAARAFRSDGLGALPVPRMPARPKTFLASTAMAYLGISGLYVPFTAEPTVNATLPDWEIPFTAAHELAHQHGFAREDDANYVGYRACRAHPDRDFRYSGTFRAALYALSALSGADRPASARVRSALPPPLQRDLRALAAWAARYEGPLAAAQERVNHAYLKTQGQPEGVRSYGRMVDLLVAERRAALARRPDGAAPER